MTAIFYPYLGKPGAMLRLPSPNGTFGSPPALGDSPHALLSGGTVISRRLHAKRTFTLPFVALVPDDADLLLAFYLGLYAPGPYVFVDSTQRNVLGLDTSTVGLRTAAPAEWVGSSGTISRTATGGPTGLRTGVLTLTGAAANATLQPGLTANTANVLKAPAYLPLEPCTVSLYIKASAAASMSLQLAGYNTSGAVTVTSSATAVSATTAWQRFTVSIAAGAGAFSAAAFVLPRLVLGASAPTSVSVAAGQVEYADTASAFQQGSGSPRVSVQAPGRDIQVVGGSDHTLTLVEA